MIIGTHDRHPGELVLFVGEMDDRLPLSPACILPTLEDVVDHLAAVTIESYDEAAEHIRHEEFDMAKNCIIIARECIQWQHLITLNGGKLPS